MIAEKRKLFSFPLHRGVLMPMQRMQEGRRPSMPLQPRSTGTSLSCCCRRPPLTMTMLLTGLLRESSKKLSRALLRISQISNNTRCELA